MLGEFITSQLAHHAKALELYTLAYQHVQHISEEEVVEVCICLAHILNTYIYLFVDSHTTHCVQLQ